MKSPFIFLCGFFLAAILIFFSFKESDSGDLRPFERRDRELSNLTNTMDGNNRKLAQLVFSKSADNSIADSSVTKLAIKISEMRIDFISFLRRKRGELTGNVEGLNSYTGDTLRMSLFQNPFDKEKTEKFLFGPDANSCLARQIKDKLFAFERESNRMTQAQYGNTDLVRLPTDQYDFFSQKFIPWEQYRFKNCSLVEAVIAMRETEMDCLVAENQALTALLKQKSTIRK